MRIYPIHCFSSDCRSCLRQDKTNLTFKRFIPIYLFFLYFAHTLFFFVMTTEHMFYNSLCLFVNSMIFLRHPLVVSNILMKVIYFRLNITRCATPALSVKRILRRLSTLRLVFSYQILLQNKIYFKRNRDNQFLNPQQKRKKSLTLKEKMN